MLESVATRWNAGSSTYHVDTADDIRSRIEQHSNDCGSGKLMVIIDCVDSLNATEGDVMRMVLKLSNYQHVTCVIYGSHSDNRVFRSNSQAVISVYNLEEYERKRKRDYAALAQDSFMLAAHDNCLDSAALKLVLKKPKVGKIFEETALFTKSREGTWRIASIDYKKAESEFEQDPSVIDGVSFNIKVSESQKRSRSAVKLPYVVAQQQQSKPSPTIMYVPDQADDYDDEDPDADLDF
jgi:hypothetical protein